jgi:splicing factor 3B subunit 2
MVEDKLKSVIEAEEKDKGRKLTKNEKNRLKAKLGKQVPIQGKAAVPSKVLAPLEEKRNIEYVSENLEDVLASANANGVVDESAMEEFKSMFGKFAKAEDLVKTEPVVDKDGEQATINFKREGGGSGSDTSGSDSDDDDSDASSTGGGVSKRQIKRLTRMSVAELKQRVEFPELVEAHDVAASDPEFLVSLKGNSKTVGVPRHWSQKRKYLHGGRGREKPPYTLPEFIEETGIARIKDSLMKAEEAKKAKGMARDRVRPSIGKIDIDYQVLHDAFFKYQTKPRMTGHGEIYYENKEYEFGSGVKDRKPGKLSSRLLEALGVVPGSKIAENPALFCPPWLINQQRYGPPPSYSHMRIPGLNCPIPTALGAQFGYHAGGWGKPPVDEYGRPIYGDVFGVDTGGIDEGEDVIDRVRWGEYENVAGGEEEDNDDDDSEDEEAAALQGIQGAGQANDIDAGAEPTVTNYRDIVPDTAGWTTDQGGLLVPPTEAGGADAYLSKDTIDLRKRAAGRGGDDDGDDDDSGGKKQLYTVVKEAATSSATQEGTLFGSAVTYSIDKGNSSSGGEVTGREKEGGGDDKEDQRQKKRRRVEAASSKLKDFKF